MDELENDDIMIDAPLVRMPKSSFPVYLIDVKSYDRMKLAMKIVDMIIADDGFMERSDILLIEYKKRKAADD